MTSPPERLEVFWVGSDRNVTTAIWPDEAGHWVAPFPVAGRESSQPGAIAAVARKVGFIAYMIGTANHLDTFWVGPQNNITTSIWPGL